MRRSGVSAALCGCLLVVSVQAGHAQAVPGAKWTHVALGEPIGVSAGQEFYSETKAEMVSAYRLKAPFKGSMPGTMGMSFTFAIDTDVLVSIGKTAAGWEYFVPQDHKYRAYHSLLGSVLRGADAVGLRVGPEGQKEWFVDNSVYAKTRTIWTRPIKPGDPELTRNDLASTKPNSNSIERLYYLGLTSTNRARIRIERDTPSRTTRDDFTFPLTDDGKGEGAVDGAAFAIEASPLRATITVSKGFDH